MKPFNQSVVNQINPAKLLLSKWTAASPINKEKHFLVTRLNKDEWGVLLTCTIEAVLTHREYNCDWRELKDNARWLAGWH